MRKGISWCIAAFLAGLFSGTLLGCGEEERASAGETQEIVLYAAKSLNPVLEELIGQYEKEHPEVDILGSYDSSGTLMEGILNGHQVDIFFSAAKKQMQTLQAAGYVVEDSCCDLLNNQVCLITYKGSNTSVTGLSELEKASSLALAHGSVPVGRYTRVALVNAGLVKTEGEAAELATEDISAAFSELTINECGNVGAVVMAVAEHVNEVGTVYYSDLYGRDEALEIIEALPYELTGDVIYPVAQIKTQDISQEKQRAVDDFMVFLQSEEAELVFERYYFDFLER